MHAALRTRPSGTLLAALTLAAVVVVACAAGDRAAEHRSPPPVPSDGNTQAGNTPEAFEEFQRKLDAYLALRRELSETLAPLEPTADAAELAARQGSLAAALREARRDAKPGDLIPAPVAAAIRTIVTTDFEQRDPGAREAAVHEVPADLALTVNGIYPPDAALSTIPPLLLAKLPVLPDNLQYRLVDRHVVLLDGDTHIVVDLVTDALPPK